MSRRTPFRVPRTMRATLRASRDRDSDAGEPSWWVRDVVIVLAVGLILTMTQAVLDDRRENYAQAREERRERVARERADEAEQVADGLAEDARNFTLRLENLRFVRALSRTGRVDRPFQELDLSAMNLRSLRLDGADFRAALLPQADLDRTLIRVGDLREADLSRSTLRMANLSGSDLEGANLASSSMLYMTMRRAYVERANLRGAFLMGSDLRRTYFNYSDLSGANLRSGDFRFARFYEANLNGSLLVAADLRHVLGLERATLEGACYDASTKWPSTFAPPPMNAASCDRWAGQ